MEQETEIWKEISGYEGLYLVSNLGKVVSLVHCSKWGNRSIPERVKTPRCNNRGYLYVNLSIDKKQNAKTIHRLVAEAFIPNPDNKPQVNHKNGIKVDNRACNLEWMTPQENIDHSVLTGLKRSRPSILNTHQVRVIRRILEIGQMKQRDIAKIFKVHEVIIGAVKLRKGAYRE